jgi:hypothetical protein
MVVMGEGEVAARSGAYEGALRSYLWSFDHGGDYPAFSGLRHSMLLTLIVDLGATYPAALAALRLRQQRLEYSVLRDASPAETLALDSPRIFGEMKLYVDVCGVLGDLERSVRTYDDLSRRLPPESAFRSKMLEALMPALVEGRSYARIAIEQHVCAHTIARRQARQQQATVRPLDARTSGLRMTSGFVVDTWAGCFEALVGTGDRARAREFGESLIRLANSGRTFGVLIERALRAGGRETARELYDRARRELSADDLADVEKAGASLVK